MQSKLNFAINLITFTVDRTEKPSHCHYPKKKKKHFSIDLNFPQKKKEASKQIPRQFTQTLRLFAEKMQETIKTEQNSRMRDSKKKKKLSSLKLNSTA